MDLNFLQARVPLVKHFQRINNAIESMPYPLVSSFTSHLESILTPNDLCTSLTHHASKGYCALKGILDKPLINESRAGHTNPNDLTEWILIDIDGIHGYTHESFMCKIGLANQTYVVQYSASSGVRPDKGLSCHIFVMLNRPIAPAALKEWLVNLNFEFFKDQITLNKIGESLHWPIDITTCQNDKLIYIAPPICLPPEIDQFLKGGQPRIQLILKSCPLYVFPNEFTKYPHHHIEILLNTLRGLKELPKQPKAKIDAKTKLRYSPNPQPSYVSDRKVGDEFTSLNLAGGDSWGYYHLTKAPYLLYNFKGEPIYKISELLPDYWDDLQKAKHVPANAQQGPRTYLAFRDFRTDAYYNGWYDNATKELELSRAASKDKLCDFLAQYGVEAPDYITDWNCRYDPDSNVSIDISTHQINWFKPSVYMLQPSLSVPVQECPRTILRLLHNIIGRDPPLVEHFLNWCAVAYRYRRPCGTAWILQGVPGTGKGMFVHEVLKPIFGEMNVAFKRMTELADKFNEYIENTLICFIDEIAIGEDLNHDRIMADLKQQITEPVITVRKMRTAAYQMPNYTNWIFSTNNKQPIRIEEGDRRYNVGEFCEVALETVVDTYKFVEEIKKELSAFTSYLHTRKADKIQASRVVHNEARRNMIEAGMVTADVLAKDIINGDLMKLLEYVDDLGTIVNPTRQIKAEAYSRLLKELILTPRDALSRTELAIIFDATVGKVPIESAKFTKYLGWHGIVIKPIRIGDKIIRGIKVNWINVEEARAVVQDEAMLAKVVPISAIAKLKELKAK